MRIAFVIARSDQFGMHLAEALQTSGHAVECFYLPEESAGRAQDDRALELRALQSGSHAFNVLQLFGMQQARMAGIGTSTPTVVTLQETPPDEWLPGPAGSNIFFIIDSNDSARQALPCLDCIPSSGRMECIAERYLRAYRRVVHCNEELECRPWGYYVVLAEQAGFKVKKTVVYPGLRLSLQRHQHRNEHWYILQGRARVTLNDLRLDLAPGQSADIPSKALHRIENTGCDNVIFIEVQTGDYFGEDDIERLEDDFGRTS